MTERIAQRIQHLNETRGWPWMRSGVVTVGLDEQGQVTRYLATDTDLAPLGPVSRRD